MVSEQLTQEFVRNVLPDVESGRNSLAGVADWIGEPVFSIDYNVHVRTTPKSWDHGFCCLCLHHVGTNLEVMDFVVGAIFTIAQNVHVGTIPEVVEFFCPCSCFQYSSNMHLHTNHVVIDFVVLVVPIFYIAHNVQLIQTMWSKKDPNKSFPKS